MGLFRKKQQQSEGGKPPGKLKKTWNAVKSKPSIAAIALVSAFAVGERDYCNRGVEGIGQDVTSLRSSIAGAFKSVGNGVAKTGETAQSGLNGAASLVEPAP